MKKEPEARSLTLDRPMQFSLGAGTRIASCNVKLENITSHDLAKGQDKRDYAAIVAGKVCHDLWVAEFGKVPIERLQSLTIHDSFSVTCEYWVRAPEKINVKDLLDGNIKTD